MRKGGRYRDKKKLGKKKETRIGRKDKVEVSMDGRRKVQESQN